MLTILLYILILWGIIALAWLVAWCLKRRGAAMSGQFTNIVLFAGFLFGFLLATLQIFAANHYSDARSQARSGPTSLAAMYDDLGVFPAKVRTAGHRAIICYLWSVAERDWKAQERGDIRRLPTLSCAATACVLSGTRFPRTRRRSRKSERTWVTRTMRAGRCCSWLSPRYRQSCGRSSSPAAAC
jgi:hypothetical protein